MSHYPEFRLLEMQRRVRPRVGGINEHTVRFKEAPTNIAVVAKFYSHKCAKSGKTERMPRLRLLGGLEVKGAELLYRSPITVNA